MPKAPRCWFWIVPVSGKLPPKYLSPAGWSNALFEAQEASAKSGQVYSVKLRCRGVKSTITLADCRGGRCRLHMRFQDDYSVLAGKRKRRSKKAR